MRKRLLQYENSRNGKSHVKDILFNINPTNLKTSSDIFLKNNNGKAAARHFSPPPVTQDFTADIVNRHCTPPPLPKEFTTDIADQHCSPYVFSGI